jgi:hypothetical protein
MFIPKKRLERAAERLLVEFSEATGRPVEIPIPLDDILEGFLQLDLKFEDLPAEVGPGVLGATFAETREVWIDFSLDSVDNPGAEGRCRFTIAHEIAHWRLHDPKEDAPMLCTKASRSDKPPKEWQADFFAACLLMPREFVQREWSAVCASSEEPGFDAISAMARRFDVSEHAMRIRLQELALATAGE